MTENNSATVNKTSAPERQALSGFKAEKLPAAGSRLILNELIQDQPLSDFTKP